jgi:hypothetical protein
MVLFSEDPPILVEIIKFDAMLLRPINHVLLLPPLLETRICTVFFFSFV